MKALSNILAEKYTLENVQELESQDPMYKALATLFEKLWNKEMFLPLIVANALVCYQLSSTSEEYWDEFANEVEKFEFKKLKDVYLFFIDFLPKSEGNRNQVKSKIERLKKLDQFLSDFFFKQKFYYKNMDKFRRDIAKWMKQTEGGKTIIFSVKMFGYGCRIRFEQVIPFPYEIPIASDARHKLIFKHLNDDDMMSIDTFFRNTADELQIPPLHLDTILTIHHQEIIGEVIEWFSESVSSYWFEQA